MAVRGFANLDMKIRNKVLLETVFAFKGDWSPGIEPGRRVFDGVEIAPFKNDAKAAACISADLEMSWAFRRHAMEVARERGSQSRENIPYLLRIFEECAFPITWATVGHLFLDRCERASSGRAHPDMPRPPDNQLWRGDWYMHDPCTNYKKDPFWYAPDVIRSIQESSVGHEIGTHSFSHIDFSPECSHPTLVRREIEESATAMQCFGISPRSLAYPFNKMGHAYLDLLSELSITAVRHRDRRVRLSYPERTVSGVHKLYESMNLRSPKHYDYVAKVKLFMAKAMERRAVFHLWFHPSDPASLFENELLRIIQYIDAQRRKGLVWIATMGEISAYCEARERLRPEVERREGELRISWRGSFENDKYGSTELSLIFPAVPRPRKVIMGDGGDVLHMEASSSVEANNSNVRMAEGRVLINMPTTARSLRLVF